MLSEKVTPYISDQPLGKKTLCVSFPVLVEANDVSYGEALSKAKSVFESLSLVANRFQSESIKTSMNPIEEKLATETAAELSHSRKQSTVRLYLSINARFIEAMDMWEKLEKITGFLDAIREFSGGYDSNKQIRVYAGVRHGSKFEQA